MGRQVRNLHIILGLCAVLAQGCGPEAEPKSSYETGLEQCAESFEEAARRNRDAQHLDSENPRYGCHVCSEYGRSDFCNCNVDRCGWWGAVDDQVIWIDAPEWDWDNPMRASDHCRETKDPEADYICTEEKD